MGKGCMEVIYGPMGWKGLKVAKNLLTESKADGQKLDLAFLELL